jgi:hypothetical protein
MSAKRQNAIAETAGLLADRGIATPEFMHEHSPEQVLDACEAWCKRVGIVSRGAACVGIATSGRYPNLLERLLARGAI